VTCQSCGAENRAGGKFCDTCGALLSATCAVCGNALRPQARFCDECGTSTAAAGAARTTATVPAPVAERRHVSILFADLVGFTALSAGRDAEEVRELLTRYFDASREVVRRYGGTVEKFIGDAVMAVWGAPVAHEDDAERAVRAGLDLIEMVVAMGAEVGITGLQARAGVLTGEAAVTLGADAQGMVAGDLVNTASRIQSAAAPGTVLVGEATRRLTEAALTYEDAGEHAMKGKDEPLRLWRAVRVVALRGGVQKSAALEPPFTGRERELRLVKDLFHACAEERRAHLVSLVGIPGIGKSRLAWEFIKYMDGLADTINWQRGRCLAYGEGVTYWALAEIVRMRAGIVEGEEPAPALAKLRETLVEYMPDEDERHWVEPRLAHLVGLESRVATDPTELFSAWRLFFERLADMYPTVLLFEDIQWADQSLLDFIEYLMEWSKGHPLFVLTIARPELTERRPSWGAGRRNVTSLYLEPLPPRAMREMLSGLVPGLPEDLTERILERAAGIPLYAVETIRMLMDRGLLTRDGDLFTLTGSVDELDVPDTLHALIAARLDGLPPGARQVLQDAAVLGKMFTAESVSAVSGRPIDEVEATLRDLLRMEVLSLQSDARSPERGQYGFMQDLVRAVAYETLSRRDRKALHLAAAEWLERNWSSDDAEIVEVLASHFLEAYRLAPDDADARAVRDRASGVLVDAAEHAAGLAATAEAQHYYEQAIALVDSPTEQARLHERAGAMAWVRGQREEADAHFTTAIALFDGAQMSHAAARVVARLGETEASSGHVAEALERMEGAYTILAADPPDADLAALAAQLARWHALTGAFDISEQRARVALNVAEALQLPDLISQALNTQANIALSRGNREESLALYTHALQIALDHDISSAALRAYNNAASLHAGIDSWTESLRMARDGLALARRAGERIWEYMLIGETSCALFVTGGWDEAVGLIEPISSGETQGLADLSSIVGTSVLIEVHRGNVAAAQTQLDEVSFLGSSADSQSRSLYWAARGAVFHASGRMEEALAAGRRGMQDEVSTVPSFWIKEGFAGAAAAALEMGDVAAVEELLLWVDGLPLGRRPPALVAHASRVRGRLAARSGQPEIADREFARAIELFSSFSASFWAACARVEWAELLVERGDSADAAALAAPAAATLSALRAVAWLERVRALAPSLEVAS
jgi:class 3 adenylate cyclase/tetratricopeptide (TPR) repeat protein